MEAGGGSEGTGSRMGCGLETSLWADAGRRQTRKSSIVGDGGYFGNGGMSAITRVSVSVSMDIIDALGINVRRRDGVFVRSIVRVGADGVGSGVLKRRDIGAQEVSPSEAAPDAMFSGRVGGGRR